jgi:hypothetical protein
MELLNVVQYNETEYRFDVRMRNTSADPGGVGAFAIEGIQWQLLYNTLLLNGGALNNTFLTYVPNTTDLVGTAIVPQSANFTSNQVIMQWITSPLAMDAQTTLFNDGNWKRIGTFKVILRNQSTSGSVAKNWADGLLNLVFNTPSNTIVTECNYYEMDGWYYRADAAWSLVSGQILTNSVNNKPLFSRCFTGTGNYSDAVRWNNAVVATDPSYHVVPSSALNNVSIGGYTTAGAISPGFCSLSDSRTVNQLTVRSTSNLTITSTGQLTANGTVYVENSSAAALTLKSAVDGTGSLIQSTVGITGTMERYMSNADWTNWKDGWHFLSSPVASQAIDPAFTTSPYDFYSWYEPENTWVNYKNTGTAPTWATANTISNGSGGNNTANFLVGKGYMAAYDVEGVKEFSGVLNVSDVQVSGLAVSVSGTNRSWHLLGNPFSSALMWSTGWTMSNIFGVAAIWNEAGQSYTAVNAGEPIPATQGVMVRVSSGTGSLTIPAASRTHSLQPFYKTSGYPVLKLFAHNIDYPSFQESQVRFNPDSEKGFDPQYDGEFLAGYAPFFYSVLAGEKLAVNSMPSLTSDTEVPFTFVKNEGSNFKIEAQGTEDLTYMAWLLDKKTNTDHNLSENPVYLFNASPEDSPERFLLHFGSVSVGDETHLDNFAIWYNSGSLYFSALPVNCVSVAVIDMAGRELKTVESPKVSKVEIGQSFAKGWYLAKVTTTDSVVVRKIFIN